jgi:GntR family transcriptional regulator/MocR family aminotransferase
MFVELDGDAPLVVQITRSLRAAIVSGTLRPGAALPATRTLAAELGVSRNTVVTAYEQLCAEQLAVAEVGRGTFVAAAVTPSSPQRTEGPAPAPAPLHEVSRYAARLRALPAPVLRGPQPQLRYDMRYGEPLVDPLLMSSWRRALGQAAMNCRENYPPCIGEAALRRAIAEYVLRRRGVLCDADDVVIVSGTHQAICLLARILLDEGDRVAVEDPGYEASVQALQAGGARLVDVPFDAHGLEVSALPRTGVRMILVTPSHQFPTGAVMSLERRRALLEHADATGSWVIEDDYDGEFRYDGTPLPALRALEAGERRVSYVGTFSKVLFPGLRLGYVVCPRALHDDLVAAKRLDDRGCSSVDQLALAQLMESGAFDRHLRRAAVELRRRRASLLDGLRRHAGDHVVVHDSCAGMHVVGWLPAWPADRVRSLVDLAAERGLGLHSIAPHYRRAPPAQGLLFGYATLSVKQLGAATALLGACLRDASRSRAIAPPLAVIDDEDAMA